MTLKNRFVIPIATILFFLIITSISYAIKIPEKPNRYVVDLANIIEDTTEMKLNGYLQELDQKTTIQFVILTIDSLEGESIEDFSIDIANNKWKLGRKNKDNGLLFLVSLKDRKYRIEVGYGIEGILPDSLVGSIGRKYLVPFLKKGDYTKGIWLSTIALVNKIASDSGVGITGMQKPENFNQTVRNRKSNSLLSSIIFFIFFILVLILFIKNPQLFLFFLLSSSMGGRRNSWGGGFGGSGFGSFGGGGGGSFGGGGTTGSW